MAGKKKKQICGARNRRGLSCQCKLLYRGGKCKFHGGLSTGPTSTAGKAKALKAMFDGLKRWRDRWSAELRNASGIVSVPASAREPEPTGKE